MAQQTVLDKTKIANQEIGSLDYFLKIAEDLNSGKSVSTWTLQEIENLLRGWAVQFDPNLEKVSFDQIISFLKSFSEEDQESTSVPTAQVEQLVEELKHQEKTDQEIKQEAIEKADQKITRIYAKKQLQQRLTQSPLAETEKTAIAENLLIEVQAGLNQSNLPILLEKLAQSSTGENQNQELSRQTEEEFSQLWEKAVDQTGVKNNLSEEKKLFLVTLAPFALSSLDLLQVYRLNSQFQQQINILEELQTSGQELSPRQKDEIVFYQTKNEALKKDQAEKLRAIFSSTLDPQKKEVINDQFVRFFTDNLIRYTSQKPTSSEIEKAALITLWQTVGSQTTFTSQEVQALVKNLSLINPEQASDLKKVSALAALPAKLLDLKDSEGKTVFDQVKQELVAKGINIDQESSQKLIALRFNLLAIEAFSGGLQKKDLETKLDQLLKSGALENSLAVNELRGIMKSYDLLLIKLKEAGFSVKQLMQGLEKDSFSLTLSLSSVGITIASLGNTLKSKFGLNFFKLFNNKPLPSPQFLFNLLIDFKKVRNPFALKLPSFSLKTGSRTGSFLANTASKIIPPKAIARLGDNFASVFSGQNSTVNSVVATSQRLTSVFTEAGKQTKSSGKGVGLIVALVFGLALMTMTLVGGSLSTGSSAIPTSDSGCFIFEGPWSNDELIKEKAAIDKLSSFGSYFSSLCQNNQEIKLIRAEDKAKKEDNWCYFKGDNIYITSTCLGSEENVLYSLAHESGHIYASRNGAVYEKFYKIFGNSNRPEGPVCTYPFKPVRTSEDFPESIALYITNHYYPKHIYNYCGGKPVILQTSYPFHYTFIKENVF